VGIVGRGEDHYRRTLQVFVFLDLTQDLDAAHVRQIEIEQDQQRLTLEVDAAAVLAEEIVDRGCTVGERLDLIVDTGSPDVALDQPGVSFVVLDHHYCYWQGHESAFRLFAFQLMGRVMVKVLPLPSSEATDMVPPRRRTSARTWASPMPCPGLSWVPARRNRSKMR